MTPYIYLFIREDLSIPQQIIQTAHAVDSLSINRESDNVNHMVLIGIENEEELKNISKYLQIWDIEHKMFYEPDITSHTAIATNPLRGKERNRLKKFNLMK